MKHLFLARHSDYYKDRITAQGRQQMELLGLAIKQILNGNSAYLISSTVQRAVDSSQVLVSLLNLPEEFEKISYLHNFDKEYWPNCFHNAMALIDDRRPKADGLIIVTHADIVSVMFSYFMKKEYGQKSTIADPELGEAIHFDIEQRIHQFIPKRE